MYLWFFKKMSSTFFPSTFHDAMLHDVSFVWIDLSFICPKFHHHINDIFCNLFFLLILQGAIACQYNPQVVFILLLCLLIKILHFVPMSWPIVVKFWVELETTILLITFLAVIHQDYDQPLYPTNLLSRCQQFQMQFHIVLNSQPHLTLHCSRWVVLEASPWLIVDTQGLSFRYHLM